LKSIPPDWDSAFASNILKFKTLGQTGSTDAAAGGLCLDLAGPQANGGLLDVHGLSLVTGIFTAADLHFAAQDPVSAPAVAAAHPETIPH
jgi:hypothetical protein